MIRRPPPAPEALDRLAERTGIALPDDYRAFMASSDGGDGDVGERWLELWLVERILGEFESNPRYEGVVLFASDGANTLYGLDRLRDGEIVEGDWIGLNRDELIPHGRTLQAFLRSIAR